MRGAATPLKLLAICLTLVACVAATVTIASPSRNRAPAAIGPRLLGPTASGERIGFTLLLRMPGARRLRASLAAIEDPRSPQFRHFIDPRSLGRRFGISLAQQAGLERSLRRRGIRVTASYPQRTALTLSGTVASVGALLHVHFATYSDAGGHHLSHAPVGRPYVPIGMRRSVAGVSGLDTRPRWHAHDVPMGGLTPETVGAAYDITGLRNHGISGKGMRIAIISFSDYNHDDPAVFASRFGITGPAPRVISVDGGTSDTGGAGESNLDIDVVRAVAPDAQILFYEAPQSSSGYTDVINRIVADHRANIISSSWGQCELGIGAERAGDSQALAAAAAAGVSMFVATGDAGAYDCQQGNLPDHRLSVDWPASSANAIGVGGTRLYLAADGSYLTEGGWEDVLSNAGGGGGLTTGDPRPSWQSGPGVLTRFSNGRRQLPDVSADADPGTGWLTYSDGRYGQAGGTSAAAPFWASSMLLISQYAASRGAGRLGYVNPMLYALASSRQRFPPYHDVRLGGNRFYQAAAGWDPATGLGSPDVFNLARDVVAYLKAHPAR